jgi:hypothetical protein
VRHGVARIGVVRCVSAGTAGLGADRCGSVGCV